MQEQKPLRSDDPHYVGPYRLVRLLGEGGQGTVYRGESRTGDAVAVKLLHARLSGDAKARARFAGELAHARQVAPFCTARILDADVDGDRPFIVSEFISGPTLSELIADGNVPGGPALDRLAIATVTALAAIHEGGIVHRDFKPSNVIMGSDGARVIDFGIARALEATGTVSSAVVGTPSYMAPEQISAAVVGPAADVFAWGCTIAYASSGVAPFGQDSIPAVMHRIQHGEPDLGKLTGPLRDIIAACLAKDPARRPTAREILLRLLGAKESPAATETLLTEGARVSAFASPPQATPGGQGWPAAPTGPWRQRVPPRRALATVPVRPRPRVRALAVAFAALLLGASTPLSWAKVVIHDTTTPNGDTAIPVTGISTIWGIATLIVAVIALFVVALEIFTRKFLSVWAALPGAASIAATIVFFTRRHDLNARIRPQWNLPINDLHDVGLTLRIATMPGWYIASAASVAIVALALTCLVNRKSSR